jgi:hypothetical protein
LRKSRYAVGVLQFLAEEVRKWAHERGSRGAAGSSGSGRMLAEDDLEFMAAVFAEGNEFPVLAAVVEPENA